MQVLTITILLDVMMNCTARTCSNNSGVFEQQQFNSQLLQGSQLAEQLLCQNRRAAQA
jgi:hypothetical protein